MMTSQFLERDMLNRKQAQDVLNILGKPTFSNCRNMFRTWKWYTGSKAALKKLGAAGIPVHSYTQSSKLQRWVPESITVSVPTSFQFKEFKVPERKPKEFSNYELIQALNEAIGCCTRKLLLSLCKQLKVKVKR
jgi:hypothetical protein